MLSLNVKSNVKSWTRDLDKIQKRQVPFATARALTWTAQAVQKAIQDRIQRVFENRKKWWLKQQPTGIKIKPAKKTHLIASIYTDAYFADEQEFGGLKRPHRGRSILVPSDKVPKSRRKAGGAGAMLKQKTVFSNRKGVFRRVGGKKSRKVALLFWRTPSATVKPRLEFRETARRTAAAKFKQKFMDSLSKALKTAR